MNILVGDVNMSAEDIEENRSAIITLRDAALQDSRFDWAVTLSYTIALLAALKTMVEIEVGKKTTNT